MDGPTNDKTLSTMTNAPDLTCFGCYTTNPVISYEERLEVLRTAVAIIAADASNEIDYCLINAVRPGDWDDTAAGIDALRCDGLVEVCYEMNGINVWGEIVDSAVHYDIRNDDYQEEHDNFDWIWWKDRLMPATQCAHEHDRQGIDWQTTFSKQDLCSPVGSKGGNE